MKAHMSMAFMHSSLTDVESRLELLLGESESLQSVASRQK